MNQIEKLKKELERIVPDHYESIGGIQVQKSDMSHIRKQLLDLCLEAQIETAKDFTNEIISWVSSGDPERNIAAYAIGQKANTIKGKLTAELKSGKGAAV